MYYLSILQIYAIRYTLLNICIRIATQIGKWMVECVHVSLCPVYTYRTWATCILIYHACLHVTGSLHISLVICTDLHVGCTCMLPYHPRPSILMTCIQIYNTCSLMSYAPTLTSTNHVQPGLAVNKISYPLQSLQLYPYLSLSLFLFSVHLLIHLAFVLCFFLKKHSLYAVLPCRLDYLLFVQGEGCN